MKDLDYTFQEVVTNNHRSFLNICLYKEIGVGMILNPVVLSVYMSDSMISRNPEIVDESSRVFFVVRLYPYSDVIGSVETFNTTRSLRGINYTLKIPKS